MSATARDIDRRMPVRPADEPLPLAPAFVLAPHIDARKRQTRARPYVRPSVALPHCQVHLPCARSDTDDEINLTRDRRDFLFQCGGSARIVSTYTAS